MKKLRPLFIGMTDIIVAIIAICIVGLLFGGCINPNTGSSTVVGKQTVLPSITDSTDSITVNVYENVSGAKIWTARDSVVKIDYKSTEKDSFIGIFSWDDEMNLGMTITPLNDKDYKHE